MLTQPACLNTVTDVPLQQIKLRRVVPQEINDKENKWHSREYQHHIEAHRQHSLYKELHVNIKPEYLYSEVKCNMSISTGNCYIYCGEDKALPVRQSCETLRIVRQWIMVMRPAGLGIKNDCAGEAQQQLTRPTDRPTVPVSWRLMGEWSYASAHS
jgi:hypothetical protein